MCQLRWGGQQPHRKSALNLNITATGSTQPGNVGKKALSFHSAAHCTPGAISAAGEPVAGQTLRCAAYALASSSAHGRSKVRLTLLQADRR